MEDKKNNRISWDKSDHEEAQRKTTSSLEENRKFEERPKGNQHQVFKRNYYETATSAQSSKAAKIWDKYKTFIISALTAVIIGSFLGFIMLTIFVDLDPEEVQFDQQSPITAVTSSSEDKSNAEGSQTEHQTTAWPFFVIQAGIFSEKETADQLVQSLKTENINSMIWQREDKYHVFTGIHPTHQDSKQFASENLLSSKELYAGKEWTTISQSIKLSEAEKDWLTKIETEIDQLIQNPANRSNLEKLLNEKPANNSENFQAFYKSLEEYLSMDNQQSIQTQLLKILNYYEGLSNK